MMQVSRVINASRVRVWEILIDTWLWPVWGPSVAQVESPSRYLTGGLRGRVKTAVGIWLNFEVSEFTVLQSWRWRVAGLPATVHRLRYLDENCCELTFELPLLAFPYALICQQALHRIDRLAREDGHDTQTDFQGVTMNPERRERKPSAIWRSASDYWQVEVGRDKRSEK